MLMTEFRLWAYGFHQRRQWHPTPVLLPGKSHGQKGAWWAAVHGVTKSRTWLSNFIFTFHFHTLEKEMATHSSVPAWRIPGIGEPGGLPSTGSHRVGHDWSDLAAAAYGFHIPPNFLYLKKFFPNKNFGKKQDLGLKPDFPALRASDWENYMNTQFFSLCKMDMLIGGGIPNEVATSISQTDTWDQISTLWM